MRFKTLPFYTGNITILPVSNERPAIQLPGAGALACGLDGDEERLIMLSPLWRIWGGFQGCIHSYQVYGTRINGFGPVHDSSAFLCQDPVLADTYASVVDY